MLAEVEKMGYIKHEPPLIRTSSDLILFSVVTVLWRNYHGEDHDLNLHVAIYRIISAPSYQTLQQITFT